MIRQEDIKRNRKELARPKWGFRDLTPQPSVRRKEGSALPTAAGQKRLGVSLNLYKVQVGHC